MMICQTCLTLQLSENSSHNHSRREQRYGNLAALGSHIAVLSSSDYSHVTHHAQVTDMTRTKIHVLDDVIKLTNTTKNAEEPGLKLAAHKASV